jgi:hypothetical protein
MSEVIRYDLAEDSDGIFDVWPVPPHLEGRFVKYEDYAALQQKLDMAQKEIARRDAIFIPVYPDENLMNRLTDVFHDTAKIHCDEDSVYVKDTELVITAIINHYLQSPDRNQLRADAAKGGSDDKR